MTKRYSVNDELAVKLPAELEERVKSLALNFQPPKPRARKKPPSFADWRGEVPGNVELRGLLKRARLVHIWGEGDHRLYGYPVDDTLVVIDLTRGRLVYCGEPPAWYPDPVMTAFELTRPLGEL
jgi:hypothetical protein